MNSNTLATAGAIISSFAAIVGINAMSNAIAPLALTLDVPLYRMSAITSLYLVAQIASLPTLSLWLKNNSPVTVSRYASLIFTLASLLCALSKSFEGLAFARVIQGLSSGILIAVVPVIIKRYHDDNRHATLLSYFSVMGATAPIVGPVFVGFLNSETVYLMFVLCAILSFLGLILLHSPSTPLQKNEDRHYRYSDVVALFSLSLGLGVLIFTLDMGHDHGWLESSLIRAGLYSGTVLFFAGVVHQANSQTPVLPIKLLFSSRVGVIILSGGIMGALIYGFMYLIPYYLTQALHASPEEVLVVVLYTSIPQLALLPFFPLLRRYLSMFLILLIGGVCVAISILMLSFITPAFTSDMFFLPQTLRAIGIPLCAMSLTLMLVSNSSHEGIGEASTLYATMRALGGAVSISATTAYTIYKHAFYAQSQFHPDATRSNTINHAWHYAFADSFSSLLVIFSFFALLVALWKLADVIKQKTAKSLVNHGALGRTLKK